MRTATLFPTLFIAALLAGCGQAGALYLPTEPATQPQPPVAPAPSPAPEEAKKEQK